jgi:hypothetical protein
MLPRRSVRVSVLCLFIVSLLVLANTSFKSSAQIASKTARPGEIDVRGQDGLPRGTALRSPTPVQLKALAKLENNSSDSDSRSLATLSRSTAAGAMNPNTPVWAALRGRSGWESCGAARSERPRNQGRPRTAARTELAHSSLFQLSLNRAKVTC